jgi:hypothetical protein
LFIGLLTSLGLVLAVNIHTIIAFSDKVVNIFSDFFNILINKCSSYFDILINKCSSYFDIILNSPIQNSETNNNYNNINNSDASQSNSLTNNSSTAQGSGSGGAGDGGKDNNKEAIPEVFTVNRDIIRQVLLAIVYIFHQILNMRQNTSQTNDEME